MSLAKSLVYKKAMQKWYRSLTLTGRLPTPPVTGFKATCSNMLLFNGPVETYTDGVITFIFINGGITILTDLSESVTLKNSDIGKGRIISFENKDGVKITIYITEELNSRHAGDLASECLYVGCNGRVMYRIDDQIYDQTTCSVPVPPNRPIAG